MSDSISRQAAIRWVKTECNPYGKPTLDYDSGVKVIEHLKNMPSAEAVPLCDDCTRCTVKALNRPSADAEPSGDIISRQWLLDIYGDYIGDNGDPKYHVPLEVVRQNIKDAPSAEAEPMTEKVREALMRLTMCAREECGMCKYKDECDFDFQYKISTDNMNTLADALMRSKCEVDAKSAEAEWIPVSERMPNEDGYYLCCNKGYLPFTAHYHDGQWHCFDGTTSHVDAWMPLPKPYKAESEEI